MGFHRANTTVRGRSWSHVPHRPVSGAQAWSLVPRAGGARDDRVGLNGESVVRARGCADRCASTRLGVARHSVPPHTTGEDWREGFGYSRSLVRLLFTSEATMKATGRVVPQ